jgi:hypothetical protein
VWQQNALICTNGSGQLITYDVLKQTTQIVRSEKSNVVDSFAWTAPEWSGRLGATAQNSSRTQINLFEQQTGGTWVGLPQGAAINASGLRNAGTTLSNTIFLLSPEPFVWNNRSYIMFVASTKSDPNNLDAETEVWVARLALQSGQTTKFCKVSTNDGTVLAARRDPEVFIVETDDVTGNERAFIYYQIQQGDFGIYRSEIPSTCI